MSCCILRSNYLISHLNSRVCRSNLNRIFNVSSVLKSSEIKCFSTEPRRKTVIFGIETSCDDTGCAIVNESGKILGEGLHSQQLVHLRNGGIIPPLAQDLHRNHIEKIANSAFENAGLTGHDIDAVAVTVKPGLSLSLMIGLKYAKHLCRKFNKPIIPIHHMEAHALTARMEHDVQYPFLVLLISGGHCLLALVKDVNDFKLIGTSIDDSPGEAFDKTARRLKLRNIEQFSKLSGGPAIELAASLSKNPDSFDFTAPMTNYRDCDFSFAGMKNKVIRHLLSKERLHGIQGDEVIPELYDLCSSFQFAVTRHLCHRTQRAMEYINIRELLPEGRRTLVVSGGVACNDFIAKGLGMVCGEMGYELVRPRRKLCTDNGVMIAWNGVEKALKNIGLTNDLNSVFAESKCSLGENISQDLKELNIKCKWIKLGKLLDKSASVVKN